MAVLEKGTGLDRSLYRLPALLLDDFADATPALLRQAYVEALYRADEWDYTRITERHWQRILYEVSNEATTISIQSNSYVTSKSRHLRMVILIICCDYIRWKQRMPVSLVL
jgi:hypothetical protein